MSQLRRVEECYQAYLDAYLSAFLRIESPGQV